MIQLLPLWLRWLLAGMLLLCVTVVAFLHLPGFGASPHERRWQRDPQLADGTFRNQLPTSILAEGHSSPSILLQDWLNPVSGLHPPAALPAVRVNLSALDRQQDVVIWLGHASFLVQLAGQRILIDPLLGDSIGPKPFSVKAFAGTRPYSLADLPPIDVLLITHDHWDHLDYDTITALRGKVGRVLVPLGVGAHFVRWGYAADKVQEGIWYQRVSLSPAVTAYLVPARHYSGRGLRNNGTLWAGYALVSAQKRLLFSGDSGFGPHFRDIGQQLGPFDLAALDMGQYDSRWPLIHMTPEEAALAATQLGARQLLPAHVGRFSLARHRWDEPFDRIVAASVGQNYQLRTPRIGEPVDLNRTVTAPPTQWWRTLSPH